MVNSISSKKFIQLAPKGLSLDEFKAKITWRYDCEIPLLQLERKNPSHRNFLLIN